MCLSYVACRAVLCFFFTLFHELHNFGRKGIDHKINLDFLYQILSKNFSFKEELSKVWSKIFKGFHIKYSLFLSDFNETWIFSIDFRKILKYQISRKSVLWQLSYSTRTDGQSGGWTDMKKLIVAFSNFVNASKI